MKKSSREYRCKLWITLNSIDGHAYLSFGRVDVLPSTWLLRQGRSLDIIRASPQRKELFGLLLILLPVIVSGLWDTNLLLYVLMDGNGSLRITFNLGESQTKTVIIY